MPTRSRFLLLITCLFTVLNLPAAETTHTYQRVVSLAPNFTQCIYAIGAQQRLVGVSDFDKLPPGAEDLKKVGGWANPNFEVLRALDPDLLIVLGRHEKVRQFAAERGITVQGFDVESIAQIRAALLQLGRMLGASDRATSVVTGIDQRLAQFKSDLAAHPDLKRPRVFLCIGRQEGSLGGLTTVTGGSFLQEALELAGGENVFADVDGYYPGISKEALLARRPEVIIELREGPTLSPEEAARAAADWRGLQAVPAVRDGRVYVVRQEGLLIPGPNFPDSVAALRQVLWPAGLGK